MRTERLEDISRREATIRLLTLAGACLLPNLKIDRVSASVGVEFGELVRNSGKYEPERIYPFLHRLSDIQSEYTIAAGKISTLTEGELVSQLASMVVTDSNQFFQSFNGQDTSSHFVSWPVNLDPYLYTFAEHELHRGSDWVTNDPHLKNTLLRNPIRGRLLGHVDQDEIHRLSDHTPILQVVDQAGSEITLSLNGHEFALLVLYGHLKPWEKEPLADGSIIEVGRVLGDVTAHEYIGPSSTGPHCHVELFGISQEKMEAVKLGKTMIQQILQAEEIYPSANKVYLDLNLILKFLPGKRQINTGVDDCFWNATKNYSTWKTYHGKYEK